jgi:hypothetical protein
MPSRKRQAAGALHQAFHCELKERAAEGKQQLDGGATEITDRFGDRKDCQKCSSSHTAITGAVPSVRSHGALSQLSFRGVAWMNGGSVIRRWSARAWA